MAVLWRSEVEKDESPRLEVAYDKKRNKWDHRNSSAPLRVFRLDLDGKHRMETPDHLKLFPSTPYVKNE